MRSHKDFEDIIRTIHPEADFFDFDPARDDPRHSWFELPGDTRIRRKALDNFGIHISSASRTSRGTRNIQAIDTLKYPVGMFSDDR
ncbi:MAG: hypothetical protein MPK62_00390 [Alphaproteobacteria bacterium]|nr:hypothetical protein [Alphaproteobacteria bacterium]MDA8029596.1 hypothetical protein [Alphaproteobacteria bacterium]